MAFGNPYPMGRTILCGLALLGFLAELLFHHLLEASLFLFLAFALLLELAALGLDRASLGVFLALLVEAQLFVEPSLLRLEPALLRFLPALLRLVAAAFGLLYLDRAIIGQSAPIRDRVTRGECHGCDHLDCR